MAGNVTGDTYRQDEDGYFWFQARSDDMIVSSGYNIAGPEVEAAVLSHPSVAECAVVGVPDEARGVVVKAFVVLHAANDASPEVARAIQDHVKAEIAPFKYPRQIEFCATLPKTESGKLHRFAFGEIMPGLEAIAMPGHTPGHTGLMVTSGNERLLIFADVFHGHVEHVGEDQQTRVATGDHEAGVAGRVAGHGRSPRAPA